MLLKNEHVQCGTHPYVCGHPWTHPCTVSWYFTFHMHVKWLNSLRNGETSVRAVAFSSQKQYTSVRWNMHSCFTLKENAHKARICITFLFSIAKRCLQIFYIITKELAFWYETDSHLSLFFNFYWWYGVEREELNENHQLPKTVCLLFLLMAMHEQNNQLCLWCDPSQSVS